MKIRQILVKRERQRRTTRNHHESSGTEQRAHCKYNKRAPPVRPNLEGLLTTVTTHKVRIPLTWPIPLNRLSIVLRRAQGDIQDRRPRALLTAGEWPTTHPRTPGWKGTLADMRKSSIEVGNWKVMFFFYYCYLLFFCFILLFLVCLVG